MRPARKPFEEEPSPLRVRAIAPASVMLGSSLTILPMVTNMPLLPPFGLLLLLGWRLLRPDVFRIWAAAPLGLFDDCLSGQPIGSAMLFWTICFFVIDMIDNRLMFRDFWQNWLIAAGSVGFCLIAGRLVATPLNAQVDTPLLLQILVSILLYPLAARTAGWLDLKRGVVE
jgi:rod shape-determining protein MreD